MPGHHLKVRCDYCASVAYVDLKRVKRYEMRCEGCSAPLRPHPHPVQPPQPRQPEARAAPAHHGGRHEPEAPRRKTRRPKHFLKRLEDLFDDLEDLFD